MSLWLDWLVIKRVDALTFNRELDLLVRVAKHEGVSAAAVLLYSLELYRDSQTPAKKMALCFPRGCSGKPSMGEASDRSKRTAKAAPTREYVA